MAYEREPVLCFRSVTFDEGVLAVLCFGLDARYDGSLLYPVKVGADSGVDFREFTMAALSHTTIPHGHDADDTEMAIFQQRTA